MKRALIAEAVAAAAPDYVVLAGLGTAGRTWRDHGGDNPTFFASDPMGAAPGIALGAAVARPDLQFLLLEGDGDLVMNLGVLIAVADTAPQNLRVVVFNNGRYETGGGQPLAAGSQLDLAMVCRGAGWPSVTALPQDAGSRQVAQAVRDLVHGPSPGMLVAAVDPQPSPYGGPGEDSGAEARARFQKTLSIWESQKGKTP